MKKLVIITFSLFFLLSCNDENDIIVENNKISKNIDEIKQVKIKKEITEEEIDELLNTFFKD